MYLRSFSFGKRLLLLPFCPNSLRSTPPDRASLRWLISDASEVIDLLDEEMTDREDEPCLEGSDDELGLSMSEDEERLVNTTAESLDQLHLPR